MNIKGTASFYFDRFYRWGMGPFSKVNESACFLTGNQKAGTTILAALISEAAGLSLSPELRVFDHETADAIRLGRADINALIRRNRYDFSFGLIKDNHFAFMLDALRARFPENPIFLVCRDPRDNIRSILDRLKLPGDRAEPDYSQIRSAIWRSMLSESGQAQGPAHHIEALCKRWNLAAEALLRHHDDPHVVAIRYEDFLADKAGTVYSALETAGLDRKTGISHKVNVQHQSKGNRNRNWLEFFGQTHFDLITDRCRENMLLLGYDPDRVAPE